MCDFETARKRELEEHLLTRHEIIVSFTHSTGRPRNRLAKISHIVEENVDTVPKMLMAGLILCLYLSTYAFLMLTFCRV